MARVSLKRAEQAVWVECPLYPGEAYWLRPLSRKVLNECSQKSLVKEWDRGQRQIVERSDNALFGEQMLRETVIGWRGVEVEYEDGLVSTVFSVEALQLVVNARPIDFLLWLQRAATDLAEQQETQQQHAEQTFRPAGAILAGLSEDPVRDV